MCLTKRLMPLLLCALLCAPAMSPLAQTTAFTYQGRLTAAGNPASGDYDLQFKLFDALAAGAQQGATLTRNPVAVSAGVFTVTLDFGANVFAGAARYLEIGVRPAGNSGPYTVLAPRQQITSTPYAIQTLNAMQLGGVDASRYLKSNANGNVGIGTANPLQLLHVNGRARIGSIPLQASAASVCFNATGDLLQCGASSLRLKTNVKPFGAGLDIVRRLRPISFNWKEDGRPDIGLGAEDVARVAPSLTYTDGAGEVAGVKYERLNILLVNAINEQQQEITQLKRELRQLQASARRHWRRGRR